MNIEIIRNTLYKVVLPHPPVSSGGLTCRLVDCGCGRPAIYVGCWGRTQLHQAQPWGLIHSLSGSRDGHKAS